MEHGERSIRYGCSFVGHYIENDGMELRERRS